MNREAIDDPAWVKEYCLAHNLHLTPVILEKILERIAIKIESGEKPYKAKIDSINDYFEYDF